MNKPGGEVAAILALRHLVCAAAHETQSVKKRYGLLPYNFPHFVRTN
jgi:hypothetical protein